MGSLKVTCLLALALAGLSAGAAPRISGERRLWHKVTLTFVGPRVDESASTFRNYKFDVTFTMGSKKYTVPGYFAADGSAAETSATEGNKWRVHFSPDKVGRWQWTASFKTGKNIAIKGGSGSRVPSIDGSSGSFTVIGSNKGGIDNRAAKRGRLDYVKKHYLQWAGSGDNFIKLGGDSPENLLAYEDFDNTGNIEGRRKSYSAHARDYNEDGKTWKNGKGKELFGALNYLAKSGNNVQSFLTMNIGGDGRNVFMYVDDDKRDQFDVSKCDQWERIFEHMDKKGMYLHFKTQETENDNDILTIDTRKLYYRELVARFSHHLALNWNIGEENTNTVRERNEFSKIIGGLDPYNHHIVIHTYPNNQESVYGPILRSASENRYTGASIQSSPYENTHSDALRWIRRSARRSNPWVVATDEIGPAQTGVFVDGDRADPNHNEQRREFIYGNLMAGGAGIETYTGASRVSGDLWLQDFRFYDQWWKQCRIAREFFEKNKLPVHQMKNADGMVSNNAWLLKKSGLYVIYIKSGRSTNINLSKEPSGAKFSVSWYSPTSGGSLQTGSLSCIRKGGRADIGNAPSGGGPDWLVILRKGCTGAPTQNNRKCFEANNAGLISIPAESAAVQGTPWKKITKGGRRAIEWRAENRYRGPEADGDLVYNFRCPRNMMKSIYLMSSRRSTGGREDENNDVWVTINNGNPTKLFTSFGSASGDWRYSSRFDIEGGGFADPQIACKEGKNTITLSGRSENYQIDYILLAPSGASSGDLSLKVPASNEVRCTKSEITPPDGRPIVEENPRCYGPPAAQSELSSDLAKTVAIQVEDFEDLGMWELKTFAKDNNKKFIEWTGPDQRNETVMRAGKGQGRLYYPFTIESKGTYQVYLRSGRKMGIAGQHNDAWVAIDSIPLQKLYTALPDNADPEDFRFSKQFELKDGTRYAPSFKLNAGKHRLRIVARSEHFRIDSAVITPINLEETGAKRSGLDAIAETSNLVTC